MILLENIIDSFNNCLEKIPISEIKDSFLKYHDGVLPVKCEVSIVDNGYSESKKGLWITLVIDYDRKYTIRETFECSINTFVGRYRVPKNHNKPFIEELILKHPNKLYDTLKKIKNSFPSIQDFKFIFRPYYDEITIELNHD